MIFSLVICAYFRYLRCPPGRFSDNSTLTTCKPCHAGRFGKYGSQCVGEECIGDIDFLCTGSCTAGYFCPEASFSSEQEACGGSNYYCPQGSSSPMKVLDGYYSIPLLSPDEYGLNFLPKHHENKLHKSGQKLCDPGFWCKNGIRYPCSDDGTYGIQSGYTDKSCTAPCPLGHYCLPFVPKPVMCPPGTFGESLGLKDSSCSGLCEPGFYCEAGSTSSKSVPCPEGTAGLEYGLKNYQCSHFCDVDAKHCVINFCSKGYYCPSNSTSQKQFECGSPHLYCPPKSSKPTNVRMGYYTIGNDSKRSEIQSHSDQTTRWGEKICEIGHYCIDGVKHLCPAGKYGNQTGLTNENCSGDCKRGYFCPPGSIISAPHHCGSPRYYCPEGSPFPSVADEGHFTSNGSSQSTCPPGSFCVGGVAYLCPAGRYGSSTGLSSNVCDGPSEAGYYTPIGSTSSRQFPCPAGTFGVSGMQDEKCMGLATPGYYTPLGSSSAIQKECGGKW